MYLKLYESWRREKLQDDLQPLPKNFYEQVQAYLTGLRESQRTVDRKTLRAALLDEELHRAEKLLSNLIELRFRKIVKLLAAKSPMPKNLLTDEELHLFQTVDKAAKYREAVREGISPEKKISLQGDSGRILVRFKKEIPAIIGVDVKTYGPFKPEDVASLPLENAEALIRQGVAVRIEVRKPNS